jgi:3-oxoacyl-[acyl-carrier protein] reductase
MSKIVKFIKFILTKRLDKLEPLCGLENKVIVITGASKGLGKAISEQLILEKCKVVMLGRGIEDTNQEGEEEKTGSSELLRINCDVKDFAQCHTAIKKTIEKFGKIDVLINNAGVFNEKPLELVTESELNTILDVNLKGAIQMAQACTEIFKKQKYGTIINIGSKISHNTNILPNKTLYAATKYGVEGFSFALNKELKEFGCRVICLMPGTINTFLSLSAGDFLQPSRIAQLVAMIIKFDDLDFEGIVVKSIKQNI